MHSTVVFVNLKPLSSLTTSVYEGHPEVSGCGDLGAHTDFFPSPGIQSNSHQHARTWSFIQDHVTTAPDHAD